MRILSSKAFKILKENRSKERLKFIGEQKKEEETKIDN